MADYHLDMAFDWDSEPKGGYAGYLQLGLVSVTGSQGADASLADLGKGDTVEFYLYDISEAADTRTAALPQNWITFSAADEGTPQSSPFSAGAFQGATIQSGGTGSSTAFPGTHPMWNVMGNGNRQLSVPIVNDGRFFFTVQLSITNSSGVTKTFGVDPEMIVKP